MNGSCFSVAALAAAVSLPALVCETVVGAPIPDTFLYQGYLEDGGAPANGMYDIRVHLYANAASGTFIAGTENNFDATEVVDGRFELAIDFSGVPAVFETMDVWADREAAMHANMEPQERELGAMRNRVETIERSINNAQD